MGNGERRVEIMGRGQKSPPRDHLQRVELMKSLVERFQKMLKRREAIESQEPVEPDRSLLVHASSSHDLRAGRR